MAGDARALCALLAAVLDAEALQSDALHTLGAQLVGACGSPTSRRAAVRR